MSKTTILYKDIAPGAAEDAEVSTTDALDHADPALLAKGVSPPPIITAELNAWALNGTCRGMEGQSLAFWSKELSGDDCMLENPAVITVLFDRQYSSTGLTLQFDPATGDWCPLVNIKWYQGDVLKADVDFEPNAAQYFCRQNVTSYDKILITLRKTKHPRRRARLNRIIFGIMRYFDMTEIRKASITNETDLLAAELPISVLKWTLYSRDDVDFLFQLKQPVEVRNGDSLIGVYYIDGSRRIGSGLYDIDCFDAIGVLSESTFNGGIYTDKSAAELLAEILDGDFGLEVETDDVTLTGAIQAGTKREAIQQVIFAWGVCVSTDGRETIRVFALNNDAKQVGEDRTFPGVSVETDAIVTRVAVTAHAYTEDSGGGVEIGGVKYRDTQTVYAVDNPDVTASDKKNVVEVTGATLVSPAIGQAVAQRVYDHYARRSTHSAKIVWEGERLGDCVTVPNAWGGSGTGSIRKMEVKLSNTVVAQCEIAG